MNRTLENELSNIRSVVALNKKTNRTLENELSNIRSVVALNQVNESNSWKWAFQHSISRCPEPRKRIELLKTSFPTFDQSLPWTKKRIELLKTSFPTFDQLLPWTKKTNRTLENELSNIRSVVALNQENESNSWKWAFQHSISHCPEPRKRIELLKMSFPTFDQSLPWTIKCWKAHFQEFDSFSWFRATTDRMLESSFSRVRLVYSVQGNDWSNVGKLVFKSSIRLLGSGQWLIERWKGRFQEFDSFSWFRATTESKLIELLKTSFPTFDQSLPWTKKTNRTLENDLSNARSVIALNQVNESNSWKRAFQHSISRCPEQENESNSWKWAFQHSISPCPEPRKRIELLKTSFPTLDQLLPWTKKTNRTLENELSNIRSVVALNHRMLESSFSRVRFVYLVQGKDWSNVGKLIFKSSIRFLGSGQRLIECWKAHFQEFDSFSWFRATTDRMLESSFSRVRFIYLVQGNDWRKRIELLKMSFPTFDQSLPWSNVGKLVFKSSIRFLGSGQQLIECWKLVFKSSIRLLGSGQRLIEC